MRMLSLGLSARAAEQLDYDSVIKCRYTVSEQAYALVCARLYCRRGDGDGGS